MSVSKNKNYFNKRFLKIVLIFILFAILISVPGLLLKKYTTVHNIRTFLKSSGTLAPIIFVLVTAVTNIIPLLPGTPFWVASVIIFGPIGGFILSLIANLLGSSINFFIARLWGRSAIRKLAGEKALVEVDKLPHISNASNILILKLAAGAATDYISYACGLTTVEFLPYFLVSLISMLPMMAIGFFLIGEIGSSSLVSRVASVGAFYAINYASSLLLVPATLYISKKSNDNLSK